MKVADAVRKYWDHEGAQHYNRINRVNFDKLKKDVDSCLNLQKDEIVLDFGTGPGDLALMLAASGYKNIIGLDINESMLKIAEGRCNDFPIQLIHGDGMNLPLRDCSVGAVVCKWVLWVIPSPEKAIEEMVRVLRPGGTILVISSDNIGDKGKNILHKLRGFPINHLHSCFMKLKYKRELTTKQFWRETKGKLPLLSFDQYTRIFNEKGLINVKKTDPVDYGSIHSKIFFYKFIFSLLKGVKPGEKSVNAEDTFSHGGMKNLDNLVSILSCPVCKSDLIKSEENELVCSSCDKNIKINDGILNLMPSENLLL